MERVMHRLDEEKQRWMSFPERQSPGGATNRQQADLITQILQVCVFPRLTFTTVDALFAAKFLLLMHQLMTFNFSTLLCYDRVFTSYNTSSPSFCYSSPCEPAHSWASVGTHTFEYSTTLLIHLMLNWSIHLKSLISGGGQREMSSLFWRRQDFFGGEGRTVAKFHFLKRFKVL